MRTKRLPSVITGYGARPAMRTRAQMLAPVGRWTAGAKACVVEAIDTGWLTEAEVMAAHRISADEIEGWREHLRRGGVPDLRLKKIQALPFRAAVTPAFTFAPAAAGA